MYGKSFSVNSLHISLFVHLSHILQDLFSIGSWKGNEAVGRSWATARVEQVHGPVHDQVAGFALLFPGSEARKQARC